MSAHSLRLFGGLGLILFFWHLKEQQLVHVPSLDLVAGTEKEVAGILEGRSDT